MCDCILVFKLPDDGINPFHGLTSSMSHFSVLQNGFAHFSDHGEVINPGFSEEINEFADSWMKKW